MTRAYMFCGCNADPHKIPAPPGFFRYLIVGSDRFQVPYIHGLLARDNRIIQKGGASVSLIPRTRVKIW